MRPPKPHHPKAKPIAGPAVVEDSIQKIAGVLVHPDAACFPMMSEAGASGFDYESITDVSVASDMQSSADRIRRRNIAAFIEGGRDLIAIKDRIEHGKFALWVQLECRISIRTAERMMAGARCIEKNDKLSYLPQRTLLLLTERWTPPQAIETISKRVEPGERPSHKEIDAEIAAERERQKQLEKEKAEERARRYERERRACKRLSEGEHQQAEQRREKRLARETRERDEKEARRRADAEAAAALLIDCLQERLSEFLALMNEAFWSEIELRLYERARAPKAA